MAWREGQPVCEKPATASRHACCRSGSSPRLARPSSIHSGSRSGKRVLSTTWRISWRRVEPAARSRGGKPHVVELAIRMVDGPSKPAVCRFREPYGDDRSSGVRLQFRPQQIPGFCSSELASFGQHLIGQFLVGGVYDERFIVGKADGQQRGRNAKKEQHHDTLDRFHACPPWQLGCGTPALVHCAAQEGGPSRQVHAFSYSSGCVSRE